MEMLSLHMMIIVVIFLVNCHFGFLYVKDLSPGSIQSGMTLIALPPLLVEWKSH